jgi:hypothetical protein
VLGNLRRIPSQRNDHTVDRALAQREAVKELAPSRLGDSVEGVRCRVRSCLTQIIYPNRNMSRAGRQQEEKLGLLELGRRQVARILRVSPAASWDRVGVVGDRGDKTVAQIVNWAIEHLTYHLKFVVEKRNALA